MADFYDLRHDAAGFNISHVSEIDLENTEVRRYVVSKEEWELDLDLLYSPGFGSDTLVVSLQGALGRGQSAPRFERFRSLSQRSEHTLFISDTSVSPEHEVFLAWYFGTATFDLQKCIAEMISELSARIGIRKIVICGSSGGGFAALMVGQQVKGSIALAFDPQIRPALWGAKSFPQKIWEGAEYWRDFEDAFPLRLSFVDVLDNKFPQIEEFHIIQNIGDSHHMNYHLPIVREFLARTKVMQQSFGERCRVTLEDYGAGHVAPPVPVFNRWLSYVVSDGSDGSGDTLI